MENNFQDLSGQTLKGYELRQLIGRGGFGAVYRAYQPVVEREVAIKIILPEYANHPNFVRRFESEAQFIAKLEHLHIVPMYDYWREPDTACIVMRLLKGGSLQDDIDQNGPWDVVAAARLIDQLAAALTAAHRAGVVHRDLKPANVLLDEERNAYLADFGIAKNLIADPDSISEEDRFGSPAYISPEQVMGQPVSPQTDIYSLGVVIYMMLTGRTPFLDPNTTTVIKRQLNEPLPPLQTLRQDLPPGLNAVIWRATAKRREERYPDAITLSTDFHRMIDPNTAPSIYTAATVAPTAPKVIISPLSGQTLPVDLPLDPVNPYKGLRAFQEADAHDFFGRKALIDHLANRLGESEPEARFLAVIGPSGSGKSSVVKAGLLPAIHKGLIPGSGDWFITEMTPSAQPMVELASALLSVAKEPQPGLVDELMAHEHGLAEAVQRLLPTNDGDLFLAIDQFEETFTLVANETERAHFLNSLTHAVTVPNSRLRVVITMRADFYDRPLLYPAFGELIRKRTEIILPLNTTEMEQAIVGPADRQGMRFEPGLVSAIVADVNQQPGSLPLLQFALTELFERREGYNLTLAAYQDSGGVLGSLARRAEDIYNQLDAPSQEAARQMFLRLVSLGEGTEDTKRRAHQAEILAAASSNRQTIQQVIDLFLKYRLLTADNEPQTRAPTLEVAHESLIRVWGRLRTWLDENRDDLRLHQRLATATGEWLKSGKDNSFLASGARLAQFEALTTSKALPLTDEERNYLEESIAARQRAANRLRLFVAGLVIFSIVALALAFLAYQGQITAQIEKNRADEQASISRARELAVTALTGVEDTDLRLLLSLESLKAADTYEGRNSLLSVLQSQPKIERYLLADAAVRGLAVSPDGRMLVSGGTANTLIRWDILTGQQIGEPLSGHNGRINSVAFSPDGRLIASSSSDQTVRFWDAETGEAIGEPLAGHTSEVWGLTFSPDGKLLASGDSNGSIILWDTETYTAVGEPLTGHEDVVYALTFNSESNLLVSGSGDSTVRLWNMETGEAVGEPLEAPNWVLSLAFSPATGLLASTGADENVTFWDIMTGEALNTLETGQQDYIRTLTFSSDGRFFATASQDNTIRLWDATSGEPVGEPLTAHTGAVWSASFIPGTDTIASGGADGKIILWNIAQQQPFITQTLVGHESDVLTLAFSPDNRFLASAGGNTQSQVGDHIVRLWDTTTGSISETDEGHSLFVSTVAFSPDGTMVASSSPDRTIRLWHVQTGEVETITLEESADWIAMAFSPDGKTLAVGSQNGNINLWDVSTQQKIGDPLIGHSAVILSLAFSPDGSLLASGGKDNQVIIWDIEKRQPHFSPLLGHTDWVTGIAFSPDGTRIASSSFDYTIRLWNVTTGEPVGQPFVGHNNYVTGLVFSPNGDMVLSGGNDNRLWLWDVERGERLGQPLTGHSSSINTVAISPDGKTAATGSHDLSILLWDVGLESWQQRACAIANRNLTQEEWDRHFQGLPYHQTCSD